MNELQTAGEKLRTALSVIPGREFCAKLTKSILSLNERTRNPDAAHDAGFRVRAIRPRFARSRWRAPE
jgi:hypothetical protein